MNDLSLAQYQTITQIPALGGDNLRESRQANKIYAFENKLFCQSKQVIFNRKTSYFQLQNNLFSRDTLREAADISWCAITERVKSATPWLPQATNRFAHAKREGEQASSVHAKHYLWKVSIIETEKE